MNMLTIFKSAAILYLILTHSYVFGQLNANDMESRQPRALNITNDYNGGFAKYGVRTEMRNTGTGPRYGFFSSVNVNSSFSSDAYGFYTNFTHIPDSKGTTYGLWAETIGSGNYGIYAVNSSPGGYAGYFNGRVSISDRIEAYKNGSGDGEIILSSSDAATIRIQSQGASYQSPRIKLFLDNNSAKSTITLDGNYQDTKKGRVITDELEIRGGSDFAESFSISSDEELEATAGMLVSISPTGNGRLEITKTAYDKCVAGIISGAKGISPGMIMGQKGSIADGDVPIALSGRVYVLADATDHPIQPGDLLTSSHTPGHVMKSTKSRKAHGAIIGKAMTSLSAGKGYVLVLVNLQ